MTDDRMTNCGYGSRLVADLSRRDNRTQPGVLTPGTDKQGASPEGAKEFRPVVRLLAASLGTTLYRPFSTPNPLRGCNSDLAQYSNTPALHHSARPDSRTRTRTKRLVRAGAVWADNPGLKPQAESYSPFGTRSDGFFQGGSCAGSSSLGPKKLN